MRRFPLLAAAFLLAAAPAARGQQQPAFQPPADGYSTFDTGLLRGKMQLDGKSQGIASLVYAPTGMELARAPGLLSYYRVLAAGARYGHAAREWPVAAAVRPDGALELHFAPGKDHPLELTGIFRWASPDSLDLETIVKPQVAMPRMEMFLSSYLAAGFEGLAYVQPSRLEGGKPARFLPADWCPLFDGNFLVFPRDRQAMAHDLRRPLGNTAQSGDLVFFPLPGRAPAAAPARRRRLDGGPDVVSAGLLCGDAPLQQAAARPGVRPLFALSLPVWPRPCPRRNRPHRCRLLIAKDLSDAQLLDRYARYLREQP